MNNNDNLKKIVIYNLTSTFINNLTNEILNTNINNLTNDFINNLIKNINVMDNLNNNNQHNTLSGAINNTVLHENDGLNYKKYCDDKLCELLNKYQIPPPTTSNDKLVSPSFSFRSQSPPPYSFRSTPDTFGLPPTTNDKLVSPSFSFRSQSPTTPPPPYSFRPTTIPNDKLDPISYSLYCQPQLQQMPSSHTFDDVYNYEKNKKLRCF